MNVERHWPFFCEEIVVRCVLFRQQPNFCLIIYKYDVCMNAEQAARAHIFSPSCPPTSLPSFFPAYKGGGKINIKHPIYHKIILQCESV